MPWVEAGLPVTRGTTVTSLERQVRAAAAGTIMLTGVLLSHLIDPAIIWLLGFIDA